MDIGLAYHSIGGCQDGIFARKSRRLIFGRLPTSSPWPRGRALVGWGSFRAGLHGARQLQTLEPCRTLKRHHQRRPLVRRANYNLHPPSQLQDGTQRSKNMVRLRPPASRASD